MITLVKSASLRAAGHGPFRIRIAFPGLALGDPHDTGLLMLGRFDDGHLKPGAFVGMHPHRNDEILTLMQQGTMLHRDSTGKVVAVTPRNIMMMNAGKGIYHEESIPQERYEDDVRLLQIFMRPEADDLPPAVQFADPGPLNANEARLVAGPAAVSAPLTIRSNAIVYDMDVIGAGIVLPEKVFRTSLSLIYVFAGAATFYDSTTGAAPVMAIQGDYVVSDGPVTAEAPAKATLVIFELDREGKYSTNGMYSGIH